MKKFLQDFKNFATKGNVFDMAIGIIIGGAFTAIVTSLVNDIIMPVVSLVTGKIDFANLFVNLSATQHATVTEAKEAGDAVLTYGNFITAIISFIILALVVFLMVKAVAKLSDMKKKTPEEPAAPTTKVCPYCLSEIPIGATRCPHCTSELPEEKPEC